MLLVVAKFKAIEKEKEVFLEEAKELVRKSREEEENLSYNLTVDVCDDSAFTFIEKWESAKGLEEHKQTKHFEKSFEIFRNIIEYSDIKVYHE
ncbi:MAG: putative quinol monooxygenase [Sarcina sp.]